MKIGVIGIGAIGSTIARRLASKGHEVRVANSRGPEAVKEFADEIGATATDVHGAVDGADAIVLSIPFPAVQKLPKDLFANVPASVPVIDTGNYYPGFRDPSIPEIEAGMTESVWVSKQLGRPIIKAFNNILAYSLEHLDKPKGSDDRLAIAVASDDAEQKRIAMDLVDEMGFDPLDSGSLEGSWRQQPNTPAYCCDYGLEEMQKGIAAAVKGEAQKRRDTYFAERSKRLSENASHEELIEFQRRYNAVE
jgi:predicted dinucleotide-binding enzyme